MRLLLSNGLPPVSWARNLSDPSISCSALLSMKVVAGAAASASAAAVWIPGTSTG
jgi:hypothetical protein